jgi:anaerobic dimethyl sulfoxide reductase subunit B (iron-sulfur subunit)
MNEQLAFHFDASACTGCKACMAACKDRSDLPVGVNWRQVYQYGGGGWVADPLNRGYSIPNNVFSYAVSVACMHCEKPLCVDVCPAAAISKLDNGAVLINADLCIGCRYCEWACPYSAPQFNEEIGVMTKCDFCVDLQAQGLKPACVDACVMRALDVGELSGLQEKYGTNNAIEPLPVANITFPSIVIKPHRHSQPSGHGTGRIIDPFVEV